eukprot:gene1848-4946_t
MAGSYLASIDWGSNRLHTRVQTLARNTPPLSSQLPSKDIVAQVSICSPTSGKTCNLIEQQLRRNSSQPRVYSSSVKLEQLLDERFIEVFKPSADGPTCCVSVNIQEQFPPSVCFVVDETGLLTIVCDKDIFESVDIAIRLKDALDGVAVEKLDRILDQNLLESVFGAINPIAQEIVEKTVHTQCNAFDTSTKQILHTPCDSASLLQLFDCIGAFCLGICPLLAHDRGINDLCPSSLLSEESSSISVGIMTGLAPYRGFDALMDECWKHVHEQQDATWCAVTFHGFRHSPYSFKQKPRVGLETDENMICLLITRNNPSLYMCVTGERDAYH